MPPSVGKAGATPGRRVDHSTPPKSKYLVQMGNPERDRYGMRINVEYTHPFLIWLEPKLLVAGKGLLGMWAVILMLMSIVMTVNLYMLASAFHATVPLLQWAIALLGLPALLCLWVVVQLPLTCHAVNLAAKRMKFQCPEEFGWRILASQFVAVGYGAIGWSIAFIVHLTRGTGILDSAITALGVVPLIGLFTLPLSVPTHFLASWVLLRLKFVEALVAWIFQIIAVTVYMGGLLGLIFILNSMGHRGN
jgi:hypothetical protein